MEHVRGGELPVYLYGKMTACMALHCHPPRPVGPALLAMLKPRDEGATRHYMCLLSCFPLHRVGPAPLAVLHPPYACAFPLFFFCLATTGTLYGAGSTHRVKTKSTFLLKSFDEVQRTLARCSSPKKYHLPPCTAIDHRALGVIFSFRRSPW